MGYSIRDLKNDLGDIVICPKNVNFLKATASKMHEVVTAGMRMAELLGTCRERCSCREETAIVTPGMGASKGKSCAACSEIELNVIAFAGLINNPLKGTK